MRDTGKIVAGLCAVVFVLTSILAMLSFNMERKAFDPETYRQAFANQKVYERMSGIVAKAIMESMRQSSDTPDYIKNLSEQDWQAVVSSLLPPAELKSLSDEALNSIFAYLNGKSESAGVSLAPIKQQVASEAGVQAVLQMMRAQPACTLEQIAQMALGVLTEGEITLCNPPAEAIGLMTPLIEAQLRLVSRTIPDEITLISGASGGTSQDPRQGLHRLRTILRFSPLLPLGLLLLITILAVRSLRDWLNWWGYPFLISGILGALLGWFGAPLAEWGLEQGLQGRVPVSMPPVLLESGGEVAGAVVNQILKPVTFEGLMLAGIGLIMITITEIITKRERDQILSRLETK